MVEAASGGEWRAKSVTLRIELHARERTFCSGCEHARERPPMPLIEVGSRAAAFSLTDQNGKLHTLAAYKGRKVVLYFYPKDDTPGCTDQACQFRDGLSDLNGLNAVVLGVSPDDAASHLKFAKKHGLTFPLLADVPPKGGEPAVCEAYGVWQEKSMYGKKYMGVVRTTYLIDEKGVVKQRWDKVSVPGHAAEVLAALEATTTVSKAESEGHATAKAVQKATKKTAKKASSKKSASSKKTGSKKAAKKGAVKGKQQR